MKRVPVILGVLGAAAYSCYAAAAAALAFGHPTLAFAAVTAGAGFNVFAIVEWWLWR